MHKKALWWSTVFLAGAAAGAATFSLLAPRAHTSVARIAFTDPTGAIAPLSDATSTYRNSTYGFSLAYPTELTVDEFDEGEGSRTIVFRKGEENVGFQIFITPYQAATLSQEGLKRIAPSLAIENAKATTVGTATPALAFTSKAPGIGVSRELWFAHDGRLFEVTTYPDRAAWLSGIFATLSFP